MRNSRRLRYLCVVVRLPSVGNEYLAQGVKVLDAFAGAEHNGVERAVRDVHGHSRLLPDALVESAQQGAAAGEGDATVHHVARQLGRALVERGLDRVDDEVDGLVERLSDLGGGDEDRLGQAGDEGPAADLR